ncbi:hypothetical protein MMPV_003681 [Pyropia vietnamensis]
MSATWSPPPAGGVGGDNDDDTPGAATRQPEVEAPAALDGHHDGTVGTAAAGVVAAPRGGGPPAATLVGRPLGPSVVPAQLAPYGGLPAEPQQHDPGAAGGFPPPGPASEAAAVTPGYDRNGSSGGGYGGGGYGGGGYGGGDSGGGGGAAAPPALSPSGTSNEGGSGGGVRAGAPHIPGAPPSQWAGVLTGSSVFRDGRFEQLIAQTYRDMDSGRWLRGVQQRRRRRQRPLAAAEGLGGRASASAVAAAAAAAAAAAVTDTDDSDLPLYVRSAGSSDSMDDDWGTDEDASSDEDSRGGGVGESGGGGQVASLHSRSHTGSGSGGGDRGSGSGERRRRRRRGRRPTDYDADGTPLKYNLLAAQAMGFWATTVRWSTSRVTSARLSFYLTLLTLAVCIAGTIVTVLFLSRDYQRAQEAPALSVNYVDEEEMTLPVLAFCMARGNSPAFPIGMGPIVGVPAAVPPPNGTHNYTGAPIFTIRSIVSLENGTSIDWPLTMQSGTDGGAVSMVYRGPPDESCAPAFSILSVVAHRETLKQKPALSGKLEGIRSDSDNPEGDNNTVTPSAGIATAQRCQLCYEVGRLSPSIVRRSVREARAPSSVFEEMTGVRVEAVTLRAYASCMRFWKAGSFGFDEAIFLTNQVRLHKDALIARGTLDFGTLDLDEYPHLFLNALQATSNADFQPVAFRDDVADPADALCHTYFFSGYFYPSDAQDIRFRFDFVAGQQSLWRRVGAGPYITETFADLNYVASGIIPPLTAEAMDLSSATFPYLETPVQVFYVDSGQTKVPAVDAALAAEAALSPLPTPALTTGPLPTAPPSTEFSASIRQAGSATSAGDSGAAGGDGRGRETAMPTGSPPRPGTPPPNDTAYVAADSLLWYQHPIYGRRAIRRLDGSERLLAVVPKDSFATLLFSRSVRDGASVRFDADAGLVSLSLRVGLRLYESAVVHIDVRAFVTEMLVERPTMTALRFANDLTGFFSIFLGLTFFSVVIAPTNLFAFGFVSQWTKRRRERQARQAARASGDSGGGEGIDGAVVGAAAAGSGRGGVGGHGDGSRDSDGPATEEEEVVLENRTRLWVGIERPRQQEALLPAAPWLSDLRNGLRRRRRERQERANAAAAGEEWWGDRE